MVRDIVEERILGKKPELQYILDVKEDTFLTRNVDIPAQKPRKVFQLDVVNADDFGLLKGKKQIIWEFIEVSGYADPWKERLLPNASAKARVKPYRAAGVFTLELRGGSIFVARPLLNAKSLSEAQAEYLRKKEAYEKALDAWNIQKAKAQRRMKERDAARRDYEERLAAWEKEQKEIDSLGQKGNYRKFIIRKLGINQLARIIDFPLMQVKLGFSTATDSKFGETLYKKGRKVSMIHPEINTVFSCKAYQDAQGQYLVSVDPIRENLLLVSDHEENLYLHNLRKIPENQRLTFGKGQGFFKDHSSLKSILQERLDKLQDQK